MNHDILEKVLAHIDKSIYKKINLCELSEIAGYSPFYFSKIFSEAMGMPVTGYIRIRKLQYAIVSLLEGHKVLDVALMYAFESHEGFTRAFTQLFGSTPSTVKRFLSSYKVPEYAIPRDINHKDRMVEESIMDLKQNMHQLIFEILENSIEEGIAGYCTKIDITLLPENRVKINDNGRGIPLPRDLCAGKVVLDKILAGRPITNAEYSQLGDLEQAGMQTVNSLCEEMRVTVNRDGSQFVMDYVRGIAQHELHICNNAVSRSEMEIVFKPDTAIFCDIAFSKAMIIDWIEAKSVNIAKLKINVYETNESVTQ